MTELLVLEKVTRTAGATERWAANLARAVRPPLVLLLDGPLGAGKTTFTRGFVGALGGGTGVTVQSPTFALARRYPTTPPVHHLDLYRLDDGGGLEELGLMDTLADPSAFALVEWPRDLELPGLLVGRVQLREDGPARRLRMELPVAAIVDDSALLPRRRRRAHDQNA